MPLTADQRRQFGAFLRARREALMPEAADRSGLRRRRTPGLRREEVAQRAGLSTTWYSWAEQGRDVALSPPALARLADALRLTLAERNYLFELAQRRDPAPVLPGQAPLVAPPDVAALLDVTVMPAYVLNPRWQVCGANQGADRLFMPWFESGEASLLRFVFLDVAARTFIWDWEDRARRLLAEFRADLAHRPDDPAMQALVQDLQRDSADFARFWNSHAVLAREGGARVFNHPHDGVVRYQQITLVPAAYPDYKLVVLRQQHGGHESTPRPV